jgi:signal transduction histidine kinase
LSSTHFSCKFLKEIITIHPNTICFIATAYASYDTAIQATRLGAFGYIPKPFTPEELIYQVEQGIKQRELIIEAERLKKEREANLLELAFEKSRLNAIIKSINEGVLIINRIGEIAYFNYAALKYLNISDLKISEPVLHKLPDKISDIITNILEKEKFSLKTITTQIEIKPNHELVIEAGCTPISHPDGSLAGVVVIIGNITEFKKIELIKNPFIFYGSHELKTPLAAVQGFLNIFSDKNLELTEETKRDYMVRSVVRLKGLTDLVNDLLDISRMELKTKQRELETIHIEEIITSTLQFLEFEIAKKGIVVEKNIGQNLPTIKADQNEITRLLTNLLSNAIKYNKENGKVLVEASTSSNYLRIKVADSGIGLKPDEKERMFNEFYRAKNERTRGISGTGLGLTIVKRIVDSYYGKIDVDSTYGEGTTFTISLPININ